jgi:hypothetical protein
MAYYCSLSRGGIGDLQFDVAKSYATLTVTIGVSDDSNPSHDIEFSVVGDGTDNLTPPVTLSVGQSKQLVVDIRNVTQMDLRIHEIGTSAGVVNSQSRPIWGDPLLQAG